MLHHQCNNNSGTPISFLDTVKLVIYIGQIFGQLFKNSSDEREYSSFSNMMQLCTQPMIGPSTQYFKVSSNRVHTYPPYGFTVWDITSLQCLLKSEIVNSGDAVADGCKITVGLVQMYNGEVKILNCKTIFSNISKRNLQFWHQGL